MPLGAKIGLTALAALLLIVYLLSPILTPFVLSAGLAYLGDPLVDRLERIGLSRTPAVSLVFVVITAVSLLVLILLVPLLQNQVVTFVNNIPDYLRWLQERALPAVGIRLPADTFRADNVKEVLAEHWTEAGGAARYLLGYISRSGMALLAFGTSLVLVPVVTFYLLRDWDRLVAWIDSMMPRRHQQAMRDFARDTDNVLAAFLRGQLLVMAFLAAFYSAGLLLVGLDLGLLIGLISGLVSFVPYLGFIVGLVAAGIAMLVQHQGELQPLLWIGLVYGLGQVLESSLITPWLVGDRIGLHPVAVIFAVMAGGVLFGFIGVLLALPAAAVLAVLLRRGRDHWLGSSLYRDTN